jgi:hypothetical protein
VPVRTSATALVLLDPDSHWLTGTRKLVLNFWIAEHSPRRTEEDTTVLYKQGDKTRGY